MILIFDTYSGLCNQFYDINCGINFCLFHNIQFSFRYCSFREDNLVNWYNEPFQQLFDLEKIKKSINNSSLYIDYDTLHLTNENSFNFAGERCIQLFTTNFLDEIMNIKKEFIILKQFWSIYNFREIKIDVNPYILPCDRLMNIYNHLKEKITKNEPYNFLHYRYEHDFTNHFKIKVEDLKSLILRIKNDYKNSNLKIYIATNNIKQIIDVNDTVLSSIILFKNDDELNEYNYEEKAFIDYMFGLQSNEVFGHKNSSFSHMLNGLKNTNNFYA
jgi:DNA-directed RNA polymerase subunit L